MEILNFTQADMQPRIARFSELKPLKDFAGQTGDLTEDARKAALSQTVWPLTSPSGEGSRSFWDAGAVNAGVPTFGAVYVTCTAGEGAGWHIHRFSYENFIALRGTWRIYWNGPEDEEHVDLSPHDMVSVPPGAIRRFQYVGEGEGLMMAFAYAAEKSLLTPYETVFPECELARLDRLGEEGTAEQAAFARKMREVATAAEASETEGERAYTRAIGAMTLREAAFSETAAA